MAILPNYSTFDRSGVDVTLIYTITASTTPETPAPPFNIGDTVTGINGTQYVFVQASTSITFSDFVCITGAGQANSMTSTNATAAGGVRIGIAPAKTNAAGVTNTTMTAGTYFWAQTSGSNVLGVTTTLAVANVQLYTCATAGLATTLSATTAAALGGVALQVSYSVTGVQANTQLAYFTLTWPRMVTVATTAGETLSLGGGTATSHNP